MQAFNAGNIGIAGEFRCVVTKADGTIKEDTGFQKNLILNQGLDFFGYGGTKGYNINNMCAIGRGNSAPTVTQTKLDSYIKQIVGTDKTSDYSYVDEGDNIYRMWEQQKYRFTGLNNVNISEVGLISTGSYSSDYYLTTRALIKDTEGNPTTITVKSDETLDIYYKIHKVIDTRDKTFVVNMLDGNGGSVPYNVLIRPINVGEEVAHTVTRHIAIDIPTWRNEAYLALDMQELAPFTSQNSGGNRHDLNASTFLSLGGYNSGDFTKKLYINMGLDMANGYNFKRVALVGVKPANTPIKFFPFQMQISRASDDAPIFKTNQETLTIPLEFSWGRYEGEL